MTKEVVSQRRGARPTAARGVVNRGLSAPRDVIQRITGRKRAEEALRESEQKYRELVEDINDVIYTVAADGTLLSLNLAFETIAGWSRAEWLGRPFADIIHPDDLPIGAENFQRILRGEVPPPSEIRMLAKSGECLTGEFAARPLIVDGQVVGAFGIVRDITERKRAEEALRQSEERFRKAFEDAATGMALVELDGRILQVNQVCCEVLGYSEQELTSTTWQAITHPDDLEIDLEYVRRVLAGEIDSYWLEKRYIDRDGHVVWGHLASSLVRDADGKPLYLISQIQDITERKRAEAALRESEEKYRLLADNVTDVIWTRDLNLQPTYTSPSAARLRGFTTEEAMAEKLEETLTPASVELARKTLAEELAVENTNDKDLSRSRTLELEVIGKDGSTIWTEVKLTFLRDEDNRAVGILGITRDISERKRAEEALQKAREDLEAKAERQVLRRNPYGLTFRELTVLHLVAAGEADKEIGITLAISPLTAQKHISNILAKMGAVSRTEASVRAIREGLLE